LARKVAELVDALDGNERGIHVHRHEPEIGEAPALGHPGVIELARLAPLGDHVVLRRAGEANGAVRNPLYLRRSGKPGELVDIALLQPRALDHEVHAASSRRMPFTAATRSCQAGILASTRSLSGPA